MDSRFSGDMLTEKAETYERCVDKIRARYGTNYQIILRKTIRMGGFLGFFEKEGVELSFVPTRSSARPIENTLQKPADFEEERKKILAANSVKQDSRFQLILDEVRSLKEQVASSPRSAKSTDHETVTRLEKLFDANEFSHTYTQEMLERVRKNFSLDELDDFDAVQDQVVEWIGESIKIAATGQYARPHIIVLVGPTGVGKTTTIAKFAAKFVIQSDFTNRRLNVRLITIDNFRIAAKQQLEIYANVMDVPVSAAESVGDLKKLLALYREDVDIVLIDTIGCSPKDYSKIADMRKMLDLNGAAADVYLAMAAPTKTSDIRRIIQQFELFGCDSVIITKFDETDRVGNLISVLAEKNKSVAYLTTGQRVPNDIERADPVKFLTQLVDFKINRAKIEQRFEQKNAD